MTFGVSFVDRGHDKGAKVGFGGGLLGSDKDDDGVVLPSKLDNRL